MTQNCASTFWDSTRDKSRVKKKLLRMSDIFEEVKQCAEKALQNTDAESIEK